MCGTLSPLIVAASFAAQRNEKIMLDLLLMLNNGKNRWRPNVFARFGAANDVASRSPCQMSSSKYLHVGDDQLWQHSSGKIMAAGDRKQINRGPTGSFIIYVSVRPTSDFSSQMCLRSRREAVAASGTRRDCLHIHFMTALGLPHLAA